MGVVIPLFRSKEPDLREHGLTPEEQLHLKLLKNSIEALKREEDAIEAEISAKCREEIERLNIVDRKMRDLEYEIERLCGTDDKTFRPKCGR